jgi:arylsulfatase A-like enzyme
VLRLHDTVTAGVGYRPGVVFRAATGLVTAATTAAVLLVLPTSASVHAAPPPVSEPNIVYIVLDDLSSNLVPYMSEFEQLADEGITFDNFFVTDSQCCPSRASTLTGMYPHNSGVLANGWRQGGFEQFLEHHLEDSLGPQISQAGYRTGYVGKFLNGYRPGGSPADAKSGRPGYPAGFVPPGWDEWHVSDDGYTQFDYTVAEAVDTDVAEVVRYGHREDDYSTDVMTRTAVDFLDRAVGRDGVADKPFFLAVAPFAVHSRVGSSKIEGEPIFPAAPRDRAVTPDTVWPSQWRDRGLSSGDCGDIVGGCDAVQFPDPADAKIFNQVPTDGSRWMGKGPLSDTDVARLRDLALDRIRMAQSANDLIREVRRHLEALGLEQSTYLVVTSDNGYHLGDHGLDRGKNSMFDHDIRVPFIVVPPGGAEPRTVSAVSQNTDLLPTFLDIAGGAATGSDGASLLPMIDGNATPPGWRQGALVEFTRSHARSDPDREGGQIPPTYRGLRTRDYIYVDYAEQGELPGPREAEFYDLKRDPEATANRFAKLSSADRRALDQALDRYASCAGPSCVRAAHALPHVTSARG